MIKYSEVLSQGLINPNILSTIPSHCECGAEYEFTDNLNNVCCSNRYCHLKIGKRLSNMCDLLGIDGIGDTSCSKIALNFKLKSPAQFYIVAQQGLTCKGVANFEKKCKEFKKKVDESEFTLWEYVRLMSLPGIDINARPLFDGYYDMKEFYNNLYNRQIYFVADRLGIKINADESVLAVNTFNILMSYENELSSCVNFFHIVDKKTQDINICITGGVDGYVNKTQFINHLKTSFGDKYNIIQQSSVTAKTNILICDDVDSHSSKHLKAKNMNEKAGKEVIKILTSNECYKYLKSLG